MSTTRNSSNTAQTTALKTAMILAAGHGTRMRPLTLDRSKAMVTVGGRPLVDHMIDRLLEVGVTRIVVNVHAHADHLEAHLRARNLSCELVISDERDQLLETGGGVVKALPLLGEDPIFICNIDAIWLERSPCLSRLAKAWDASTMDDLLLVAPMSRAMGYNGRGDFHLADNGQIARRAPGLTSAAPHVYAGVQIARIPPMRKFAVKPFSRNAMWDASLNAGRAFGHVMDGFWMHVGDPQARDVAETILIDAARPALKGRWA